MSSEDIIEGEHIKKYKISPWIKMNTGNAPDVFKSTESAWVQMCMDYH